MEKFLHSLAETYDRTKANGRTDVCNGGPMHPGDHGELTYEPDWVVYQCLSKTGQEESAEDWMERLKPLAVGKGGGRYVDVGLRAIEDVSEVYPDRQK
jgi:hypothetical protein